MKIKISAKTLFSIVNNTRNPKVAMQLIDGTYKKPALPLTSFIGVEKTFAKFVSYDKWSDRVICQTVDNSPHTVSSKEWIKGSEYVEPLIPEDAMEAE